MTLVCVLVGCLFPGEGYDRVLARAFGIPGLRFWPGPVPTASALWHGLEVTAFDGTTLEPDRNDVLACESGSSCEADRPLLRVVGHVRVASQEAFGMFLVHNMAATAVARAVQAGTDPKLIPSAPRSPSSATASPPTPAARTAGAAPTPQNPRSAP